jgi:hypothetical protein
MRVSVVIPVYNNASGLRECLQAVQASLPAGGEVLVVDDGSTDDGATVAAAMGASVLRLPQNCGQAVARNRGARAAAGDVLIFIDSDVVVALDAIERACRTLRERTEVAGVFGSYDTHPRAAGLVSQFRNLLHHYVHQVGHTEASTFWAGCGALRRAPFEAVGGFDEARGVLGLEDIALGYRLRAAGHRLLLDKGLLCTHLKRWTLGGMVRTDVLDRAIPWTLLVLSGGPAPDDLNLARGQRWSVALVALAGAAVPLALLDRRWLVAAVGALAIVAVLNRGFYAFLRRERGLGLAFAAFPLHALHLACGGIGVAWAVIGRRLGRYPMPEGRCRGGS